MICGIPSRAESREASCEANVFGFHQRLASLELAPFCFLRSENPVFQEYSGVVVLQKCYPWTSFPTRSASTTPRDFIRTCSSASLSSPSPDFLGTAALFVCGFDV